MNWLDRLWTSRATTPSAATKRIVCLANSRSPGGRCVAGKEFLANGRPGEWIRPISGREGEGLSAYERQFEGGNEPQVLDIIDVPVLRAQPQGHQQENWLIDPKRRWAKVDCVDWDALPQWVDTDKTLWIDGYSSSSGQNNRIPVPDADSLRSSLRLISVDSLELIVHAPGASFGNNKRYVEGRFQHARAKYMLRITDPIYECQYLKQTDGRYQTGRCFLSISLGETYHDFCYKLIAAIIRP